MIIEIDDSKIKTWKVGEDTYITDENGEGQYLIRGYGAMKNSPLDIDPRIDLTAPIYEQVQKLARKDKLAEERAKRKAQQAS